MKMHHLAHLQRHVACHNEGRHPMKHRKPLAYCALLSACIASAHAQVYKCPDASGRTVIQQAPCMDGKKLDVKPAMGPDNAENAQAARQRATRQGSPQDILLAISEGRPAIGMSESDLRMAMGSPIAINRANYEGRTSDQWVYHHRGQSWWVYVREGRVSSFQNSERTRASGGRNCPSAIEIRNLETSASSVTIKQEQKRSLQQQIAAAKSCS